MKLRDIQEARYHIHPMVSWIRSVTNSKFTKKTCLPKDHTHRPKHEFQLIIRELTNAFGEPRPDEGEGDPDWIWSVRGNQVRLFLWSYDSVAKKNVDEPRVGICIYPPSDPYEEDQ